MPSAVTSSTSQESYSAQLSQNRSDKQLASLSRNLQKSAEIGKAVGADTSSAQKALQRVSGKDETNASAKVSLSSAGVAKAKADRSGQAAGNATQAGTARPAATGRPEKKQFKSVDDAISYGADKAAEQAAKKSPQGAPKAGTETAKTETVKTEAKPTPHDAETKQSKPAQAVSYGAKRAVEQYEKSAVRA